MFEKREDMTWSGNQEDYGNRCSECSKILNYKTFDYIKNEGKYRELVERLINIKNNTIKRVQSVNYRIKVS